LVSLLDAKIHPAHVPTLLGLAKDDFAQGSRYDGERADLPIAQGAVSALRKHAPLLPESAEALYAVAIDTADPDLRNSIFELLANTGGASLQGRLFELAIEPGSLRVRRAAASALLHTSGAIAWEVTARITPELLATRIPSVATHLVLMLAAEGELAAVERAAEQLATNPKRRVLLLLLIWVVQDRDARMAERLAHMLPPEHPAVVWAFGAETQVADEGMLSDLGEPGICSEVLIYMKRAEQLDL